MPDPFFVGLGWVTLVLVLITFLVGSSNAIKARKRGDLHGARQVLWGMFWSLFLLAAAVVLISSHGRELFLGFWLFNVPTIAEWTRLGLRRLRSRSSGRADSS